MKTLSDFIFRPIKQSEYPLLEIFLYEAIFVPEGVTPPSSDIIYDTSIYLYIENFGKESDICFVCEYKWQIIGAAWARILDAEDQKGFGNIGKGIPELAISVLPDFRNQGIGTELLQKLHNRLAELGHEQISLSVQKANTAMRLYERSGYKVIKEQDDDYIMKWNL